MARNAGPRRCEKCGKDIHTRDEYGLAIVQHRTCEQRALHSRVSAKVRVYHSWRTHQLDKGITLCTGCMGGAQKALNDYVGRPWE